MLRLDPVAHRRDPGGDRLLRPAGHGPGRDTGAVTSSRGSASRTVGVEEEFLLLDPASGEPTAAAGAVLAVDRALMRDQPHDEPGPRVDSELMRQQVETATSVCGGLDELGAQIRSARRRVAEDAGAVGAAVAAVGTSPVPSTSPVYTPSARYQQMAQRFARVADDGATCGCHVHVAVDSDEEGVAVLDRIRPWLAPLIALSANSPLWRGDDTGYASYRSLVWTRWPSAGPTGLFGDPAGYHATVAAMIGTDTVIDAGMVYFDARLSARYPTVEVRVSDVCLHADDAVLVAALVRGLVETAARQWRDGVPPDPVRTEVLRLAAWRAARSGLEGPLLWPGVWTPAPAQDVVAGLVEHVGPVLAEAGERQRVSALLAELLARGTGAQGQREVLRRHGSLAEVARGVVAETLA